MNVGGVAQMEHLYHHPWPHCRGTVVEKPETRGTGVKQCLLDVQDRCHKKLTAAVPAYLRSTKDQAISVQHWGAGELTEELLVVDGF